MSEAITSVSKEVGKLRGNIKYLWELSKQSPLDRENCKNALLEIRKSFKLLWAILQDATLERVKELDPDKYILFTLLAKRTPEELIKEAFKWLPYESEISSVITILDSPEYHKDKDVKESIARLVESLEAGLSKLERQWNLKEGVCKIFEFLAIFPQFTENWSIAVCYLTAMEIVVKNKLEELGLETAKEFKSNYNTLLAKLKDKNIEVPELEKELPNIFWNIRNKVVHEGYSPTSEELEIITKYVERILKLLLSMK
jgi:hypothetical protein